MKRLVLGVLLMGMLASAGSAWAAGPALFLTIDGIPGESTDIKYPGALNIESFSLGIVPVTPVGGTTSRPSFTEISFTRVLDKASPLLYLHCAGSKPIKRAVLVLSITTQRGPQEVYTVTLSDLVVTRVQTAGHRGNLPTEEFAMSYGKIEYNYAPTKADGTLDTRVRTGWDVRNNVEIRPQ